MRPVRSKFLLQIALFVLSLGAAVAHASSTGLVISQVYGGGGSTATSPLPSYKQDYVELFNAGNSAVSLNGLSVQYGSATGNYGSSASNVAVLPAVSLAPGQSYLIVMALSPANSTGAAIPVATDLAGNLVLSNSAGKVAVVNSTAALNCGGTTACSAAQNLLIVDAAVYSGLDTTHAGVRNTGGCAADTDVFASDFTITANPVPRNTATTPASCVAQAIVTSCPASATVGTGSAVALNLGATGTSSIVNAAIFQSGNVSGMTLDNFAAAPANGSAATVNLTIGASTAAGTYPVAVSFSDNASHSASCTVNVTVGAVGAYTPIYDIQGSGTTSPFVGQSKTTRGVVTKLASNGYYLQDPVGDGNPATSDGIFVFSSTAPTVTVGQLIQVTGVVSEFNTGAATNALTLANTVTELTSPSGLTVLGSGSITPTVITLPVPTAGGLERYEGMLVTINSPMTASQNYFQGRYGQVTMSAGGRLFKPTNLHRPGTAQAIALQDLNARSSIMLDDGSSTQNPNPTPYIGADNTLRAGDTVPGLTGVIEYGLATADNTGLAMYRLQPTVTPVFTRANARTATPPSVGGTVKVASFNVLNFFTTFTNGQTASGQSGQGCTLGASTAAANCRGADDLAEFTRQRAKIVAAMSAMNADVVGLMEIQNNGNVAAQNLVDALNAVVGANTYAVVPSPASMGTDAIRVSMIYKPALLTLAGASMSDTDAINNRPTLAQAFATANGKKFSVIVNHLKSKSCSDSAGVDADQGDGQGCYNDRRKQQATRLLAFVANVKAAAGSNDVLVIGDLNAYGKEDPVDILTTGGLVDQQSRFNPYDYSYVFDGEAGYLDHGLASASMSAKVVYATHWHINADEPSIIDYNLEFKQPDCPACGPDYYSASPYRASDHDPVLLGLDFSDAVAQTISFSSLPNRTLGAADFTVSATASSSLPVTFSSLTSGVCTVSGSTVHLVTVGLCTIAANQAGGQSGSTGYLAATQVTQSFNVSAFQSINFGSLPDRTLGDAAFALSATATSGLSVTFSSLTPVSCTVSGNTVTLLASGTCTIAANQAGNGSYASASEVSQSFNIAVSGGGTADNGDAPLPAWALMLFGGTVLTISLRRRSAASQAGK